MESEILLPCAADVQVPCERRTIGGRVVSFGDYFSSDSDKKKNIIL